MNYILSFSRPAVMPFKIFLNLGTNKGHYRVDKPCTCLWPLSVVCTDAVSRDGRTWALGVASAYHADASLASAWGWRGGARGRTGWKMEFNCPLRPYITCAKLHIGDAPLFPLGLNYF